MKIGVYTDLNSRGLYYLTLPLLRLAEAEGHEVIVFPRRNRPVTVKEWPVWTQGSFPDFEETVDCLIVFEDVVHTKHPNAYFVLLHEMYEPTVKRVEVTRLYKQVVCPTWEGFARFQEMESGIPCQHLPWVSDMPLSTSFGTGFLFNAGMGGVNSRRGGPAVAEAILLSLLVNPSLQFTYRTQALAFQSETPVHERHMGSCRVIGGEMSRDDIRSLYLAHAVMVAPSRTEGCGLVFYEAIQCGLPIVTLDAPPMREYVPEGTGWLLPCRPTSRRGLAIEYDLDPLVLSSFLAELTVGEILEKRANLLHWRRDKLSADALTWSAYWRKIFVDTLETPGYSLGHSALPPSVSVRGETHGEEEEPGGGDAAS